VSRPEGFADAAAAVAHGILFHRFRRPGEDRGGQGAVTAAELEAILRKAGLANILAPGEWVERLRANALEPRHRCVTFDDGLMSQYRVALPVLDALGLQAFWFVHSAPFEGIPESNEIAQSFASRHLGSFGEYIDEFLSRCPPRARAALDDGAFRAFADALQRTAGFYSEADLAYRYVRNRILHPREFARIVDEILRAHGTSALEVGEGIWMSDAELGRLARSGHWVGLHSYDHPFELARLSEAEQRDQYERNLAHIERATSLRPRSMSHPLNSYDERTLRVLESLGIECGFRDDMLAPRGGSLNPGPLELARLDGVHLLA
jgi:peptidoglycan/xylan/chitin deacetylase (PgdA/CDA1 family)